VGFFADITADALSLPACENHAVAYSVCEVLRIAATRVLDMHLEDLQILVVGYVEREEVDALRWDPMPGGSGLLEQMRGRFEEIVTVARDVLESCPAACETSCVDCLQTFRNSYYHKYLDRREALSRLDAWGERLKKSHDIPLRQPTEEPSEGSHPVNEAERKLRFLLQAAGFPEGIRGEQVRLDRTIGTTTPDVIYRADHHDEDEGVCIYLDGLSGHIHGNAATAEKDREIRSWLRNNGYEVIEIARSDLDDEDKMVRHFRRLASYLQDPSLRDRVRDDRGRFERGTRAKGESAPLPFRVVHPHVDERNTTCIPLLPLNVAAGAFSELDRTPFDDCEWVEPS
jgi:very-short-patch-repair endonuclease